MIDQPELVVPIEVDAFADFAFRGSAGFVMIAERAHQTKATKAATEGKRIASDKVRSESASLSDPPGERAGLSEIGRAHV